jgi:hypothetical protein
MWLRGVRMESIRPRFELRSLNEPHLRNSTFEEADDLALRSVVVLHPGSA